MIRIDDIIASLILALCMMRRLEVLAADPARNPQVPADQFTYWKELGLSAYRLCAIACFSKVLLSVLWFWAKPPQPLLQIGGITVFIAWVLAMGVAWRKTTEAGALRTKYKIDTRRS